METNQRGSILFLILLSVVLFAALSYAVTQSQRGGGKDASEEAMSGYISELLNHAMLIEQTLIRLQLVNNCTDSEIIFETPESTRFTNPYTRSDHRCKIFHPNGGNVPARTVNPNILITDAEALATSWGSSQGIGDKGIYHFPNQVHLSGLGGTPSTACTNGACRSFVLGVAWVKASVCAEINAKLSANPGTGGYPIGGLADYYRGVFSAAGQIANVRGARVSCVANTTAYGNAIVYTLKLR